MDGLYMIMNDRLTEYPLVINTLKRFNLYPEVRWPLWHLLNIREISLFHSIGSSSEVNHLFCSLVLQVVLASWYRAYTSTMDFFGVPTKMCWTINRGDGLDPVESCEGIGEAKHQIRIHCLAHTSICCLIFGHLQYSTLEIIVEPHTWHSNNLF